MNASLNSDVVTSEYNNLLASYGTMAQVMTVNISDNLHVTSQDTLCTIPSAKRLISTIDNDNSIIYVNGTTILTVDTENNILKEASVYKLVDNKLQSNKQLKIADNKLYTQKVSSKLNTYANWGWHAYDVRSSGDAGCTTTLGGIPLLMLQSGTSFKYGEKIQ